MSASEFSLIAVTLAFIALVVWVYPRRRQRLESYGRLPLDDDADNTAGHKEEKQ
ncbi:MAG: cbb3-type cytochrome c oxidase subunit 3 [Pseudomonadales bacterium]